MSSSPFISIVTVVYNDEKEIEATLKSVFDQSLQDYELIVIDGKSTDDTVAIIQRYANQIHHFVSEKDKGIYDAMNKGIECANGEWIYFLNAGDRFYAKDMLEQLKTLHKDCDLVYGSNEADYGYFKRINQPLAMGLLDRGMIFSHQAMVVKTQWMKQFPYNLKYRFSADFDFIYGRHRAGITFQKCDLVFASLKADGTSEQNLLKTHNERWNVIADYSFPFFKRVTLYSWYTIESVKIILKKIIKAILPQKTVHKLTIRKYQK